MKTINSKKFSKSCEGIQLFVDPETNVQNGFAGNVSLYDSQVYIDTRNGTGYGKVIEKLGSLIYKLSQKYHFNGNSIEDTRQDIIVHILEGIPKYNPDKNTKLSTFLEMRVDRRLINELRNCSRISRNATFLNVGTYQFTCECGSSFTATFNKDTGYDGVCKDCGSSLSDLSKKMPVNTPEVSESMLNLSRICEDFVDMRTDFGVMSDSEDSIDNDVIFFHDVKKWLRGEDPRVVKIVELYCLHDYSIKAAAEEVGLSGTGGNIKLKELAKNPYIKEMLGR